MSVNGLFQKTNTGLLVPAKVILPNRPAHTDSRGKATDVTKAVSDETYAIVKNHYERLTGKAIIGKAANARFRKMVYRAADAIMARRG